MTPLPNKELKKLTSEDNPSALIPSQSKELIEAAKQGNLATVEQLLAMEAVKEKAHVKDNIVLQEAAERNRLAVVFISAKIYQSLNRQLRAGIRIQTKTLNDFVKDYQEKLESELIRIFPRVLIKIIDDYAEMALGSHTSTGSTSSHRSYHGERDANLASAASSIDLLPVTKSGTSTGIADTSTAGTAIDSITFAPTAFTGTAAPSTGTATAQALFEAASFKTKPSSAIVKENESEGNLINLLGNPGEFLVSHLRTESDLTQDKYKDIEQSTQNNQGKKRKDKDDDDAKNDHSNTKRVRR